MNSIPASIPDRSGVPRSHMTSRVVIGRVIEKIPFKSRINSVTLDSVLFFVDVIQMDGCNLDYSAFESLDERIHFK